MRIGIDVDGVVYDWDSSARRILKRLFGLNIGVSQSWDHIGSRCSKEQWDELWSNHTEDMFTGGSYYPGAVNTIETLAKHHEVFFITATPAAARKTRGTNLFLDFHGINGVIFVNPGNNDKTLLKCDVYLDDKQETVAHYHDKGHRVLLMDRPWNQNYNNPKEVHRVLDWLGLCLEVGV
jgi:uncharacterized HAD superfamily protein